MNQEPCEVTITATNSKGEKAEVHFEHVPREPGPQASVRELRDGFVSHVDARIKPVDDGK